MKPVLVILGAGASRQDGRPLGVQQVTLRRRVLDWQLDAFAPLGPETHFVGGYDIDEVMHQFPQLGYHYNPDWPSTGAAASLALALQALDELQEGRRDLYVTYSDILLRPQLVQALAGGPLDACPVAVDEPRSGDSQRTPEMLSLGDSIREFVGLLRVPAPRVPAFRAAVLQLAPAIRTGHLAPLLSRLQDLPLHAVSAQGQWAHAEHNRSVARFVLGSKAATLERLQGRLVHSRILPLIAFTRREWVRDRAAQVAAVLVRFAGEPVLIVRSSASDEDGFHRANAGKYHSELNVVPQAATLESAVDRVFTSYGDGAPIDEVLVQPQLIGVRASGVVFTRTLEAGAPYRVINYTLGEDTTAITSGSSEGVKLYASRFAPASALAKLPELGRRVLSMVEEVEDCVGHDALDVEFALDADGRLVTLQVRPLMVSDAHQDRGRDAQVADSLHGLQTVLAELAPPPPGQLGAAAVWSVMADWNPAEILGLTPGPLALDLYRHVVTDGIWAIQRHQSGYRDVRGWPLVRSFGGQAFVDVRASINSFLPKALPAPLAGRLADDALTRLRAQPALHDKLEFELLPTCLDFGFARWEERYSEAGVADPAGLAQLRDALRQVTLGIMRGTQARVDAARSLEADCEALEVPGAPVGDWLRRTLDVCRDPGALTFAHLARAGFVAAALLRSAVEARLLSDDRRAELMESVPGIGRLLTDAAWAVREGRLTREAFLARFGHLRPGTYDIGTPSYRDRAELYLDPVIAAARPQRAAAPFAWTPVEAHALDAALTRLGLPVDSADLLSFVRTAVYGREYAKFVFTRLLSASLDALAAEGRAAGIAEEQLGCMPLQEWLSMSVDAWGGAGWRQELAAATERRWRRRHVAGSILLPPVLMHPDEIHAFAMPPAEPSFVTRRRVTATLRVLHRGQAAPASGVSGRVVAVPNADPGFDYLFALGIGGLVTAYGGPNSHMAIRASEFAIPAVIGIGEQAFAQLRDGAAIEIDGQQRLWRQEEW